MTVSSCALSTRLARILPFLSLPLAITLAGPSHANDSMAVIGAGGIELATTESVSMDSEELYISPSKVTVDYVFTNQSSKDLESIVAFPMPDIRFQQGDMGDVPNQNSDNFMNFEVRQDGAPIRVELQQRAFAAGLDVTEEIKAKGVSLLPVRSGLAEGLTKTLTPEEADDWVARGLVSRSVYMDGEVEKFEFMPNWTLRSTYWWRTVFPAGKPVKVHHEYKPSVGGTVDMTFISDGKPANNFEEYKKRYCLDAGIMKAAAKIQAKPQKNIYWMEKWLSYILVTGNNWSGPIGTFHLTVDKEDPKAFVSFCGDGVTKTGPTTFEMTGKDFFPQKNLDVLIVYPQFVEQ